MVVAWWKCLISVIWVGGSEFDKDEIEDKIKMHTVYFFLTARQASCYAFASLMQTMTRVPTVLQHV